MLTCSTPLPCCSKGATPPEASVLLASSPRKAPPLSNAAVVNHLYLVPRSYTVLSLYPLKLLKSHGKHLEDQGGRIMNNVQMQHPDKWSLTPLKVLC